MHFYRKIKRKAAILLAIPILFSSLCVHAETADEENARRTTIPIETNSISGWPQGPVTHAESAILMDVNTHTILYEKNIHEKLYPASITKILTCLIAAENCSDLDEMVDISYEAVYSVPIDGTNVGLDAGQSITMEDALYAILLKSANEASNAVGEHIAGSIDGFVTLMNKRAKELGCEDSHFVTTNGIHDDNHYTSTYDMALIGSSFFSNELLCKISGTKYHQIPATDTQPDLIDMYSRNELLSGRQYAYEYLVGSKTGYTSLADNTLVTCAEKDGLKLVCVVMGENGPYHYEDTISLFEYGFSNFSSLNVSEYETRYTINTSDFFQSDFDVFGNSKQFISLDTSDTVIVPTTLTFDDLSTTLSYDTESEDEIATISYYYSSKYLGSCDVLLNRETKEQIIFDSLPDSSSSDLNEYNQETHKLVFINIVPILIGIIGFVLLVILSFFIRGFIRNYHFGPTLREKWKLRRRYKKSRNVHPVNRYQKRHQKALNKNQKKKTSSLSPHKRRRRGFIHNDKFDTSINVSKETRKRLKSPKKKRKRRKPLDVSIHFSSKDF